MRQHHVEVPLVHRHVRGLDNCAAGMVQPWRKVCKLHEIPEIRERGVAAPVLQIRDERRSVAGHQDYMITAEGYSLVWIAPVQLELPGRCRAKLPGMARREPDSIALDSRSSVKKYIQRRLVAPKLDSDLGQYPIGLILDSRKGGGG